MRLWVLFLLLPALLSAEPLRAWGVQQIPLLFPPGVANWLNLDDVAKGGPVGVYLDALLLGCGFNDSFTFVNWSTSGRRAELGAATNAVDIAFPVARQWQLSPTTFSVSSGGVYFVPILSSPGTSILIPQLFTPTTIAQALVSGGIGAIVLVVVCFAVLAGVVVWSLDAFDPNTQYPVEFFPGIATGIYWAFVTMTTTGYGDLSPRTFMSRAFTVLFILCGVLLIALLQSAIIGNLASTRDLVASQLQKTADQLNGLRVGVVNASIEEWRMRSRGADVTVFTTIEAAMSELLRPGTTLAAVAVDTLAAGLITNSLGASVVRQSGKIDDPVTYGFLLNTPTALRPAHMAGNPAATLRLAQCLDILVRTGPMVYSKLTYFRQYAMILAFSQNADLVDRQEQENVAHNAMVQAAYILPLSTLGFLLFAFYFDRGWDKHRLRTSQRASGQSSPTDTGDRRALQPPDTNSANHASKHPIFPSASSLPPMDTHSLEDDED